MRGTAAAVATPGLSLAVNMCGVWSQLEAHVLAKGQEVVALQTILDTKASEIVRCVITGMLFVWTQPDACPCDVDRWPGSLQAQLTGVPRQIEAAVSNTRSIVIEEWSQQVKVQLHQQ